MEYNKNMWATDDIITAPKLNNIESGLEFATNGLKGVTTPYQYGAKGDGTTDDTVAIQDMLNDWHNKDVTMSGNFLVTKTIAINNAVNIKLTGNIIAGANIDYIFKATTLFGIDGGGIGTINANYKSGGVVLANEALFSPINLTISNLPDYKIGIFTGKKDNGDTDGFVHANNLSISNRQATTGVIGIYSGRDSFYNNIETINIQTAIQIYGVDVFISGLHPWNDIPSVVKVGGGVHLEKTANSIFVNNYYNDSMKFAFYLDGDNELIIDNALTMWNTNVYNDNNGSGNPYFIYFSDNTLVNPGKNITVSGSPMNQKPGSSDTMQPYLSSVQGHSITVNPTGGNKAWKNLPSA